MSFSNILRRAQRPSGPAGPLPERPASATASAEFWRAFLGKGVKSSAPRPFQAVPGSQETPAAARMESSPPEPEAPPSVEPTEIARELRLSRFASVRALQRLRRDFALKNHPDRVPATRRGLATKRMMIANALIDAALKRFQLAAASRRNARPFESGDPV